MSVTRSWTLPVVVAGLAATVVVLMGATITDLGPWYRGLIQPRWSPPDHVYAAAWTGIYALTALAAGRAWIAIPNAREREWLVGLFALNGFLNIVWSMLFFRLHRPDWALVEVVALWLSVALLIVTVWRRSLLAAVLLIPYLMWVTFAGYLNMTVVRLNGPFG